MKKIILCLILFTFSLNISLNAQNEAKIEDLKNQIEKENGKTKIDLLNQLSGLLINTDPEKAKEFANQALMQSQAEDYEKGMAHAMYNISMGQTKKDQYGFALKYALESLEKYKQFKDTSVLAECHGLIALCHKKIEAKRGAALHYKTAINYHRKFGNESKIATLNYNLGTVYQMMFRYRDAIQQYQLALDYRRKTKNKRAEAELLDHIGKTNCLRDSTHLAIKNFEESLYIRQNLGSEKDLAKSYQNLGNVYNQRNENQKALGYYFQARKIQNKFGNSRLIANNLDSIASVYQKFNLIDSVINLTEKSLNLSEKISYNAFIQHETQVLARNYAYKKNFEKAYQNQVKHTLISRKITRIEKENEKENLISTMNAQDLKRSFKKAEMERNATPIWDALKNHLHLLIFGIILFLAIIFILIMKK